MRITFISPPHIGGDPIYPPMGLLNLAAVLEKADNEINIIDFPYLIRAQRIIPSKNLYAKCAGLIMRNKPEVLGFHTLCCTLPPSLNIAKISKAINPELLIIFGGPQASLTAEAIMRHFPFVDIIVRGEGEVTIKELIGKIRAKKNLRGVKGITYRSDNVIISNEDRSFIPNLDKLLPPAYNYLPSLSSYKKVNGSPQITAIMDIGRGCKYDCIYCSSCLLWKHRIRRKSIPAIISEIKHLQRHHQVRHIYFTWDLFTADRSFVVKLCQQLIGEKIYISWECRGRVDEVDPELLRLMREAGCASILYGIESGSKNTLSYIRKNIQIRKSQMIANILETSRAGIKAALSFIAGFPNETEEDLSATMEDALRYAAFRGVYCHINIVTPLPGTDLAKINEKNIVYCLDTEFSGAINFNNNQKLDEDEALIKKYPLLLGSFYGLKTNIMPLAKLNQIIKISNIIYHNTPITFYALSKEMNKPFISLVKRLASYIERKDELEDGLSGGGLLPEVLAKRFEEYVVSCVRNELPRAKYIHELFLYECLRNSRPKIEPGRPPDIKVKAKTNNPIFPHISENVRMEKFEYNVSDLADQIESGAAFNRDNIKRENIHLIFQFNNKDIKLIRTDKMGFTILQLCDGKHSIKSIKAEVEKNNRKVRLNMASYLNDLLSWDIIYI